MSVVRLMRRQPCFEHNLVRRVEVVREDSRAWWGWLAGSKMKPTPCLPWSKATWEVLPDLPSFDIPDAAP